jgi:hypothetical protein
MVKACAQSACALLNTVRPLPSGSVAAWTLIALAPAFF